MNPRAGRPWIAISPGPDCCGIGGAIKPGLKDGFEFIERPNRHDQFMRIVL
jgi:hypothetical protein